MQMMRIEWKTIVVEILAKMLQKETQEDDIIELLKIYVDIIELE